MLVRDVFMCSAVPIQINGYRTITSIMSNKAGKGCSERLDPRRSPERDGQTVKYIVRLV